MKKSKFKIGDLVVYDANKTTIWEREKQLIGIIIETFIKTSLIYWNNRKRHHEHNDYLKVIS